METWWNASNPNDNIKPRPWLHPAAVLYLESLITPGMTVIEHGCGGSTIWFSERVKHVTAVDDDSDWIVGLAQETKERENIRLYPLDGVPTLDPADLLLIDGRNEKRPEWMFAADKLVKPGGVVVVDNAERPHYQEGLHYLSKFCYKPATVIAYATGLNDKLVMTSFYRVKGGIDWI